MIDYQYVARFVNTPVNKKYKKSRKSLAMRDLRFEVVVPPGIEPDRGKRNDPVDHFPEGPDCRGGFEDSGNAKTRYQRVFVVPPGIEPGTPGFSVLCSTI